MAKKTAKQRRDQEALFDALKPRPSGDVARAAAGVMDAGEDYIRNRTLEGRGQLPSAYDSYRSARSGATGEPAMRPSPEVEKMRAVNDKLAAKDPTRSATGFLQGYGENAPAPREFDRVAAAKEADDALFAASRDNSQQLSRWEGMPFKTTDAAGQHGFNTQAELDDYVSRRDAAAATAQAGRDNAAQGAQVAALMRRGRMAGQPVNPLTATLFVGAGLNRPQGPRAETEVQTGMGPRDFGFAMSPQMMMLQPDLAKTQMQTSAYGAAAREGAAVDREKLASEERRSSREMIMQTAAAKESQLRELHQQAVARGDLEAASYYEKAIRDNQAGAMQAVASLGDMPSGINEFMSAPVQPYQPGGGVPATTVSTGGGAAGGPRVFDVSTPSGRALNESQQPISSEDRVRYFPLDDPNDIIAGHDLGSIGPGPAAGTSEEVMRRESAQSRIAPLIQEVNNAPTGIFDNLLKSEPRKLHDAYLRVRAKFPSATDEDIRYALAHYNGTNLAAKNALLNDEAYWARVRGGT